MISIQFLGVCANCAYPALFLALRESLLDGFHGGVNFYKDREVNKSDERELWSEFISVTSNSVSHVAYGLGDVGRVN
jgi:hypothetical protein